eukprot:TRINITY_DN6143_c0_g1_i5.p1 TRINITY_DN6143_c0_g1~~TRINITY_DN6143_c0_g1_i5.p1  ORF type:complete len:287 (+),score=83.42 TRINITY_DN6143_c0_g1_i5:419-1279(+)
MTKSLTREFHFKLKSAPTLGGPKQNNAPMQCLSDEAWKSANSCASVSASAALGLVQQDRLSLLPYLSDSPSSQFGEHARLPHEVYQQENFLNNNLQQKLAAAVVPSCPAAAPAAPSHAAPAEPAAPSLAAPAEPHQAPVAPQSKLGLTLRQPASYAAKQAQLQPQPTSARAQAQSKLTAGRQQAVRTARAATSSVPRLVRPTSSSSAVRPASRQAVVPGALRSHHTAGASPAPTGATSEVQALRQQVEAQQREIAELQRRLEAVEQEHGAAIQHLTRALAASGVAV